MIGVGQKACVIFNQLSVGTIENNSGVFIGTNLAVGWSSTNKSNMGFGSVSDAAISHIVNAVYDSDLFDAPSVMKKTIAIPAGSGVSQQCGISFQSVNATSVSTGSTIDIGDNALNAWSSIHKTNYGNGKTNGRNVLRQFANFVKDNDIVDASSRIEKKVIDNMLGS